MSTFNRILEFFKSLLKSKRINNKPTKLADIGKDDRQIFQLVLAPETQAALKNLLQRSENDDLAKLINKSLALYDGLITASGNGGKIFIRYEDGTEKEIDMCY